MLYKDIEKYFASLPWFIPASLEFTYGIDRVRAVLEEMKRPDKDLKVIHVAGTNGKGSVCAYLDVLLRKTGKRTGLFTSPHLLCIRERISLDGCMISEKEMERYFDIVMSAVRELKKKYQGFDIAYFEFFFLIAVLFFRDSDTDICIFETGLGGRLDAVNVFEKPVMCIITQIGLDHTAILGDDLESIAREKCGIIKRDTPLVCIEPEEESVKKIIYETAKENSSELTFSSDKDIKDVSIDSEKVDFLLQNRYYRNVKVSLKTPAFFAASDAALALTAFALLCEKYYPGLKGISPPDYVRTLGGIVREGRMEQVMPGVYVDGAHNPRAVEIFAVSVEKMTQKDDNILLFSAVKDKNFTDMVRILSDSGCFDRYFVCTLGNDRAASAESIKNIFQKFSDRPVEVFSDTEKAFSEALKHKTEKKRLFCAGSLYLVGEIKRIIELERSQL